MDETKHANLSHAIHSTVNHVTTVDLPGGVKTHLHLVARNITRHQLAPSHPGQRSSSTQLPQRLSEDGARSSRIHAAAAKSHTATARRFWRWWWPAWWRRCWERSFWPHCSRRWRRGHFQFHLQRRRWSQSYQVHEDRYVAIVVSGC